MIANISPSLMIIEETFNTLNFAQKVKLVKTNEKKNTGKPVLRIDKYDSAIQDLKNQIVYVKSEIKKQEDNFEASSRREEKDEDNENVNESKDEKINDYLKEYINQISEHFKKEININKKINELELKISNTNNEKYFDQKITKNILRI